MLELFENFADWYRGVLKNMPLWTYALWILVVVAIWSSIFAYWFRRKRP